MRNCSLMSAMSVPHSKTSPRTSSSFTTNAGAHTSIATAIPTMVQIFLRTHLVAVRWRTFRLLLKFLSQNHFASTQEYHLRLARTQRSFFLLHMHTFLWSLQSLFRSRAMQKYCPPFSHPLYPRRALTSHRETKSPHNDCTLSTPPCPNSRPG